MNTPEQLLRRLDQLGESLSTEPTALALLGLGSVGVELDRLDEYSDLDFFAIVEAGTKAAYLDSLDWMSRIQPIIYAFRNTDDGYKVLYDDGIFCEFAVFEPEELEVAAYPPARIVWMVEDFDASLATPRRPVPDRGRPPASHLVGEAVTNLYVGLLREQRGERLAAFRMIQGHALDRIIELARHLEKPSPGHVDPFGDERRFETRHPAVSSALAPLAQGYARNRESAASMLEFLEVNYGVDAAMRAQIELML